MNGADDRCRADNTPHDSVLLLSKTRSNATKLCIPRGYVANLASFTPESRLEIVAEWPGLVPPGSDASSDAVQEALRRSGKLFEIYLTQGNRSGLIDYINSNLGGRWRRTEEHIGGEEFSVYEDQIVSPHLPNRFDFRYLIPKSYPHPLLMKCPIASDPEASPLYCSATIDLPGFVAGEYLFERGKLGQWKAMGAAVREFFSSIQSRQ